MTEHGAAPAFCLECGRPLEAPASPGAAGQSTRKFCSAGHRNAWHAKHRVRTEVRSIGRSQSLDTSQAHECGLCERGIAPGEEFWTELLEDLRTGQTLVVRYHRGGCQPGLRPSLI